MKFLKTIILTVFLLAVISHETGLYQVLSRTFYWMNVYSCAILSCGRSSNSSRADNRAALPPAVSSTSYNFYSPDPAATDKPITIKSEQVTPDNFSTATLSQKPSA